MIEFKLNGEIVKLDLDPAMPLLWALRDHLGLTGTKYGCGGGYCGACTVHVAGQATRACQLTLDSVSGLEVKTIEAFGTEGTHPVQKAWAELNVAPEPPGTGSRRVPAVNSRPKPVQIDWGSRGFDSCAALHQLLGIEFVYSISSYHQEGSVR